MSEIMRPLPFGRLMSWALAEYRNEGRIFGIQKEKFYKNTAAAPVRIFGENIATAIGPAAGPNSQLAQNIIAAYLAGSRFMELKTVQKMDGEELRNCVPRPCINAQDEGYNVEWSTELTVPQAMEEYIKAWVALSVLSRELGLAESRDFVFNMSVGYDLEGIQTEKIDTFIEGIKNAAPTPIWQECIAWLNANTAFFQHVTPADVAAISPNVSNSITLSTLHGCPPAEIERIAKYLLDTKKVHTFVKCNPTLLGYDFARGILNEMGYDYLSFDDHHFNNDLQYTDAVAMLQRLLDYGAEHSLAFGVKITNTFPVKIARKELPGEEMYMSGRALFPLSINVANKLTQHFEGKLPISYSGGADAFNIEAIFKTGIRPITVATTILKPGGYERLQQLAQKLAPLISTLPQNVDAKALAELAEKVSAMPRYRKEYRPVASRKTESALPMFDCFKAPCKAGGCPIEQQIPEYLSLVAQGNYDEAFRVICIDNAAPSITGAICNHACQTKCTRLDYEASMEIRHAKHLAAEYAQSAYIANYSSDGLRTLRKAVVIGAGPGGIGAALYLRRNGVDVQVLEKRDRPFGIVEYVIPEFRISAEEMRRDFELAEKAGVRFTFNYDEPINIPALQQRYDFVVLAVGAWKEGLPAVKDGAEHLRDALAFLEESKAAHCRLNLGKRVAVIGGGDVAMDCARAAKRAFGAEQVSIVYRRTREFMPAEVEEIQLAVKDGVEFMELLAPVSYDQTTLVCEKMQLGDWDASGRRGITSTDEMVELPFDTVIGAIGARVDNSVFVANGLALNDKGLPILNEHNESSLPNVYVVGDCKAGPATIVAALADAKCAAKDILAKLGLKHDFVRANVKQNKAVLYGHKGVLIPESKENTDGYRCLACDQLCELCCDVCPNRANVRIALPGFADMHQIVHIDQLCNECGNCGIFCPHTGNPYKDKITVFSLQEDFEDSENKGFLKLANGQYMLRLGDDSIITAALQDPRVPPAYASVIHTLETKYPYYLA